MHMMTWSFFENKRKYTFINIIFLFFVIGMYHSGILSDNNGLLLACFFIGSFLLAIRNPFVIAMLFVGAIPLEVIVLGSDQGFGSFRPYQIFGVAALWGAMYHHFFTKKFFIAIPWNVLDLLVGLVPVVGAVLLAWSDRPMISLQQVVVIVSFALLYGVVRVFVRSDKEMVALIPVMISSGVVVSIYAIMQNVIYYFGGRHMEVMPGRPNATFTEPDWLGVYLVFVCALCVTYLYHNVYYRHIWRFFDISLFISMVCVVIALILSAARSAWLGVLVVFIAYIGVLATQRKYKMFVHHVTWIGATCGIALALVLTLRLTNFSLGDRFQSTQSGKQEITVACDNADGADALAHVQMIDSVKQLGVYGCRHINIEDIGYESSQGNSVVTVYRNDPNVVIRKIIYRKSIVAILERPWTGHGWGASAILLGVDERGTPLNASNIFLETAISIGIIGASLLCLIFVITGVRAIIVFTRGHNSYGRTVALLSGLCVPAIIVPQMFNAGLMMGYVWICFAIFAILWNEA